MRVGQGTAARVAPPQEVHISIRGAVLNALVEAGLHGETRSRLHKRLSMLAPEDIDRALEELRLEERLRLDPEPRFVAQMSSRPADTDTSSQAPRLTASARR